MSIPRFGVEKAGSSRSMDQVLLATVILLTGVGLVTLFSASTGFGETFFDSSTYFLKKQALFCAVGVVLLCLGAWMDIELPRRWIMPIVFGSLLFCLCPFLPVIGVVKNGAARWIHLGPLSYQPSELAKLVLPLYLAHIFNKKEDRIGEVSSGVLPPAIVTLLFFLVVYLQNDFSTALFIALNGIAIFFMAGVKLRHFATLATLSIPIALLMIFTKEYRVQRLITFLHPESDPLGAGYQVEASLRTVASGGFWGKGLGQGTRKIASVPEVHSDFVFAAFSEEAGFIGVILFFVLFAAFAARAYRGSLRSGDSYRLLLGFGLTTTLISQALVNVAVVIRAVPATGVPLPFFSAGGSSLATTLFMAGLLLNISRNQEKTGVRDV